jgi:hypothetical protein
MYIYLDTNILISKIKIKDPEHPFIVSILQQEDLQFVTGFITLLEFESIIKALWNSNELNLDDSTRSIITPLSPYQQIKTITELLLKQISLQVIPVTTIDQILINQWDLSVENTLAIAYNLAPNFPLKTLDLIQLASAFKIKLYQSKPITYFLTDDQQILHYTDEIRRVIGIISISSRDLVRTLRLHSQ